MRPLATFAVALLALVGCVVLAQTPKGEDKEQAVRGVIDSLESAWSHRDGEMYGNAFSELGDLVLPNGLRVIGRTSIARGQSLALRSLYADSRLRHKVESIRFIRPDIALAHVTWELQYKTGQAEKTLLTNSTITLAKTPDGKWMIEAFQGTPIL